MDHSMRTALFALAARRAPDYRGNIERRLVELFGEATCALYESEIEEYLQCLRDVHKPLHLAAGGGRTGGAATNAGGSSGGTSAAAAAAAEAADNGTRSHTAAPATTGGGSSGNNGGDLRLGPENHRAAVEFICAAGRSDTELTYTAFRAAFRDRFGADVFGTFKARIVALLRCIDALTTKRFHGRLLVRVRSVSRSDARTQHRCQLRFQHGDHELAVLERKVPAANSATLTGRSNLGGGGGGNSDGTAGGGGVTGGSGVFLAFPAQRCREDGQLVVRAVPKCRNVFHPGGFSCGCHADAPDCELAIPLGRVYGGGQGPVDAWYDLGESDGARITARLQLLFHETTKTLSPRFAWAAFGDRRATVGGPGAGGAAAASQVTSPSSSSASSFSAAAAAATTKPSVQGTPQGTAPAASTPTRTHTHHAEGWLEKALDVALCRLYTNHTPKSSLHAARFHIDAGAAASQLQRNRRQSTAVHMSSLLSIKERRQVVRWSARGGLAQVPESVGQARRWLESSADCRDLVWGGVPRAMRAQLYLKASGMAQIMQGHPEGYYDDLVRHPELAPHSFATVIDRDVPRTFGGMDLGDTLTLEELMPTLKRVLYAYASRNQVLGYCQSMNFVVAFFLVHLGVDERTAFWLLAACVERLAPGYYLSTMEGLQTEFEILRRCGAARFPKLTAHMNAMQASFESMVAGSLLCFFVTTVPMETAARLMDVAFFAGTDVYLATLCAVLRLSADALMEQTNIVSFSGLLKLAQVQQIDSEAFIQAVRDEYYLVAAPLALASAFATIPRVSASGTAGGTGNDDGGGGGAIEFFSGSTDVLRREAARARSCSGGGGGGDQHQHQQAQRLRSVRACLHQLFPSHALTEVGEEAHRELVFQLQQPCFLFFNVVSACRASGSGANDARQWRRAPRPLAVREWSEYARRSPAANPVDHATRVPTCPMYTQYVALLTTDYWCIPAGGSEWTRLLRSSPALLSSGTRSLTDRQLFEALDFNGDGVLNVHEIVLGMALLGPATCLPRLKITAEAAAPVQSSSSSSASSPSSTSSSLLPPPTSGGRVSGGDGDAAASLQLTPRQKLELLCTVYDSCERGGVTGVQFRALTRYLRRLLRCRFDWAALAGGGGGAAAREGADGEAAGVDDAGGGRDDDDDLTDVTMARWFAEALGAPPPIPASTDAVNGASKSADVLASSAAAAPPPTTRGRPAEDTAWRTRVLSLDDVELCIQHNAMLAAALAAVERPAEVQQPPRQRQHPCSNAATNLHPRVGAANRSRLVRQPTRTIHSHAHEPPRRGSAGDQHSTQ